MNVDYVNLSRDIETGEFRRTLEEELIFGFRQIQQAGERLPVASHYAAQIAEIVNRNAPEQIPAELAYLVYQEILEACEYARETVLGEQTVS
jgi:hypothetical protein